MNEPTFPVRGKGPKVDQVGIVEFSSEMDYEAFAHPWWWKIKAEELYRATMLLATQTEADILMLQTSLRRTLQDETQQLAPWPDMVSDQAVMLAGFTLKNLFKGLIVWNEPNLVSSTGIDKILRSYDLIELARRALDDELSECEKRLCLVATRAVVHWGRYPVPAKSTGMLGRRSVGDAFYPTLAGLVARLYGIYQQGGTSKRARSQA